MKPHEPMRYRTAVLTLGMAGAASAALAAGVEAAPSAPSAPSTPSATPAAPAPATFKRAASKVRVTSSRLNLSAGNTAKVSGRVSAADAQVVRLQRYARGRWITIGKDKPDAAGRFTLKHRDDSAGSQMVRVRFPGDARHAPDSEVVGRMNTFRRVGASWYGPGFYGNTTACGQTFSAGVMGVAHKSLPCGTSLVLRKGDRTVKVKVIDRGPFVSGRELDLSPAVKQALGFGDTGTVGVTA